MEQFDFPAPHPKPFTLVFPHIPKTGGTTLLYHFRRNLGDPAILNFGPFSRVARFFGDLPQFEEIGPEGLEQVHVMQGHSVEASVLPPFGETETRLLVVLRHPVPLTRSRFNQRTLGMARRGLSISSEEFLKGDSGNILTSLLIEKFGALADPGLEEDGERVVSILKKFNYVYTTEQMDTQVGGLMQELKVPTKLERRRVADRKTPLDVSDAEIAARNGMDIALFEQASAPPVGTVGHNPFGFDAEGQAAALARLRAEHEDRPIKATYGALAQAICQDLRAEAALKKLDSGAPVALKRPGLLRKLVSNRWERMAADLTPERAAISAKHRARWRAKVS